MQYRQVQEWTKKKKYNLILPCIIHLLLSATGQKAAPASYLPCNFSSAKIPSLLEEGPKHYAPRKLQNKTLALIASLKFLIWPFTYIIHWIPRELILLYNFLLSKGGIFYQTRSLFYDKLLSNYYDHENIHILSDISQVYHLSLKCPSVHSLNSQVFSLQVS